MRQYKNVIITKRCSNQNNIAKGVDRKNNICLNEFVSKIKILKKAR